MAKSRNLISRILQSDWLSTIANSAISATWLAKLSYTIHHWCEVAVGRLENGDIFSFFRRLGGGIVNKSLKYSKVAYGFLTLKARNCWKKLMRVYENAIFKQFNPGLFVN